MSNAGAPDSLEVHRDSAVQTPALAAWRRVSTVHLFMLLPWIGIVVAARQPIRDNSFLWHIRAGDLQVEAGRVLTVDPFSSTFAGKPWRTQAWLADLLYSWLHTIAGLSFVPWLIALASLVAVSYVGLAAARASTSGVAAAVLITMVAWIGVGFLSPRPVLFSYALLAALAVILERPRLRWSIPLLLWLWASLHGSFIVGLGLIVLTALARKRRFGRDLGAAVVAVSVTAHGLGTWMTLDQIRSESLRPRSDHGMGSTTVGESRPSAVRGAHRLDHVGYINGCDLAAGAVCRRSVPDLWSDRRAFALPRRDRAGSVCGKSNRNTVGRPDRAWGSPWCGERCRCADHRGAAVSPQAGMAGTQCEPLSDRGSSRADRSPGVS